MDAKASDVALCATALLELGARPINSFDEESENARLCSNLYPWVRDEMLREHTWNFAKTRAVLSADTAAPLFGYQNQFTLPADFIRLLEVNGQSAVTGIGWPAGYQIENGKILSNDKELHLRYIYANYTVGQWDASFLRLIITAMKRALAYAVTRDPAAVSSAVNEWAVALKQAKVINGVETPPQEIMGSTFYASRF